MCQSHFVRQPRRAFELPRKGGWRLSCWPEAAAATGADGSSGDDGGGKRGTAAGVAAEAEVAAAARRRVPTPNRDRI
jgi:hypothetical protein